MREKVDYRSVGFMSESDSISVSAVAVDRHVLCICACQGLQIEVLFHVAIYMLEVHAHS